MGENSDISIRVATLKDLEPARLFLRKFFFKDEPNNFALKLVTEENPVCEDMERFAFGLFGKGIDLVAEYEGRIVGVCLNILIEKGTHQEEFKCTPGNNFVKIARLLEHVEKTVDFFGRYPDTDKIMSVAILSVDTTLRGKGIAKKLVAKTKQLAKEKEAGVLVVECTSFYSAAVSKSLGFEEIFSLDYEDYRENGKPVLNPGPPHKAVKVFAAKI